MTAHDDARKAAEAATETRAAAYDLTDVEHRRFVRDAVAAAAPILLADAQTVFETLTVTSKARQEQVERLIAEVARWESLVDAKQSWIDGAKVDLAAAEAEIKRLQADLSQSVRAIDHYAGALHTTKEIAAAERARIAAAIRAAGHPDGYHRVDTTREWAGIYCADCAVTERSARIAETAPEETQ
ncbi:MAG: hypothetical protein AB7H92_15685 [Microbacteriaceae bacterium]